ncbi:hypothetical protein FIV31_05515 [Coxiella endosymbiont of Ornithodoros amblus]|nr:hypothetical protein [Coxiella endosymbiont of Ornithodoros amblus]
MRWLCEPAYTFFSSKLIVDTTTQGLYVWSKAEYGKIMISSIAPVFRCAHRGYFCCWAREPRPITYVFHP